MLTWRPCLTAGAIGLAWLACLGNGQSAAYAASGTGGVVGASTTEVAIVLDWHTPPDDTITRLALEGFSKVSLVKGLPPRFGNYRLVQVPVLTDAVKQQLLGVQGVVGIRAVYRTDVVDYPMFEIGQVVVKFAPGTPWTKVKSVASRYGCTVARQFELLNQVYVLDMDGSSLQTGLECANALARESSVVYSHPSLLMRFVKHAVTIDDPLYPYQWHLHNTGQLPGGVVGADIKAPEAWDITMGEGAIIGVIDDSVQKDHEDLKDNYITGHDYVGSTLDGDGYLVQDGDPSPTFGPDPYGDDNVGEGHGTCVSGIICARANTIGVRGVAPYAGLVGMKIGLGPVYSTDQDIADAFIFADTNGVMAVNNSWGGPGRALLPTVPSTSLLLPSVISDTIKTVATTGRGGRGMLVLYSAGNSHPPIPIEYCNVYGGIPQVMAIGATMRNDVASCYSAYGPEMSVCAPGGGVVANRDMFGGGIGLSDCFEADIATTDNMEVPGLLPYRVWDNTANAYVIAPGYPIRGDNPAMKFLTTSIPLEGANCVSVFGGNCYPLVPDPYARPDFPQENYTTHMNGTSSACPVTTGVAALVFSINSNLTAMEARNLIEHSADKILAPNEYWDPVTGQNDRYGHGRVNAYRAVQAAQAAKTWPSPIQNIQNVSSQSLVRIFWQFPDWDEDGVADADAAAVLVVRAPVGQLNWTPADGVEYTVGQQVTAGVVVVANSLIDTLDQTGLPAGAYDFAFFTRNGSNYYAWGRRLTVTTTGTVTMPKASISALPTAGRAPLSVHFSAGVIDPNNGVKSLTYAWDFGDGSAISSAATPDHTYTTSGEYFPQVTVTDSAGLSAKASTRVAVSGAANKAPQASITASKTSGQAPLDVVFQGVGTDPDVGGFIVRYDWDFGDGFTAVGQVVEHVFVASGTYGVRLTVTDDQGASGSNSVLISVTGTSSTLAETDPPDALGRSTPQCGLGVPVALLGVSLGLVSMRVRRRRG